jgi:PPOX class probable F420-dependent enzyme
MDLDHARDYIRDNHHAVLATTRADGRPQLSPVACGVDADGFVVVSTRETAYKTKNLLRDPRVSLCVFPDGFFGEWVQVDGTATVVRLPEALDGLVEYYRGVAGEHPDWDDYRNAMVREHRVLVRIDLERAGPKKSG